ncbi:MAG: ComEC/Rec2 family competence protein [Candidatus Dojkabacteria bacterium]
MKSVFLKYIGSKIDRLRLFKYNFERIKLFQVSLGLVLGILLSSSGSLIVLVMILIVALPPKKMKLLFYFSLFLGVLFFSSWNARINSEQHNVTQSSFDSFGSVVALNKGEINKTLTLKIDGLEGKALADVNLYSKIDVYDRVNLDGQLSPPKSFDDFDYPAYLKSNKILYEFKGNISLETKENNVFTPLRDLKERLVALANMNISIPYSSLFNGILFGDTSQIPDDVKEQFRSTGTSHILSVSGFNFTIILVFLLTLAPIFGRRKLLYASIPSIVGFLLLVGVNNVTAVRATIMLLIYIWANLVGRKVNFLYLVSITLMLFLLDYPLAWTNVSLQLSFGSLLGLFFLSGSFSKFFKKIKLPQSISEVLSASIAAIVGTLPFTLNTFGTLSIVAPLVNILVLPFVPLIMLLGFIAEAFGLINIAEISKVLFKISEIFLNVITEIIKYFASLPFANTSNNAVILGMILFFVSIFIYSDFKTFYKKYY